MNTKKILTYAAYFVAGGAVGTVATYFSLKKHFDNVYSELATDEIRKVDAHYKKLLSGELEFEVEDNTPGDVSAFEYLVDSEDLSEADGTKQQYINYLVEQGYTGDPEADSLRAEGESVLSPEEFVQSINGSVEETIARGEKALRNLFESEPINEDEIGDPQEFVSSYPKEPVDYSLLDDLDPHIIPEDVYFAQDDEYDKITLTYFEADNTLVDDRNTPIPNHIIVGHENLGKFGIYEKQPNIIYVRNKSLMTDFEVVLDNESYAKAVLGLDDDVYDALPKKRVRKMREDDE